MNNARAVHAGKSRQEKEQYRRILSVQQAPDPTYEKHESTPTDSVIEDESGRSSITEPELKRYRKEGIIGLREVIIGVVVFALTTVLFLYGMTLNREVGVIDERTSNMKNEIDVLKDQNRQIGDKVDNLTIDVEVIKRTSRK